MKSRSKFFEQLLREGSLRCSLYQKIIYILKYLSILAIWSIEVLLTCSFSDSPFLYVCEVGSFFVSSSFDEKNFASFLEIHLLLAQTFCRHMIWRKKFNIDLCPLNIVHRLILFVARNFDKWKYNSTQYINKKHATF